MCVCPQDFSSSLLALYMHNSQKPTSTTYAIATCKSDKLSDRYNQLRSLGRVVTDCSVGGCLRKHMTKHQHIISKRAGLTWCIYCTSSFFSKIAQTYVALWEIIQNMIIQIDKWRNFRWWAGCVGEGFYSRVFNSSNRKYPKFPNFHSQNIKCDRLCVWKFRKSLIHPLY